MTHKETPGASPFETIEAIDYSVIFVRDMPAMRTFYEQVMQFRLERELSSSWIEYRIGPNVLALAKQSGPIARSQPGLNSMTMHINHDGTQLMTYWNWESQKHHVDCMASDDWMAFMPKWEALMEADKLEFDLNTYEVLDF